MLLIRGLRRRRTESGLSAFFSDRGADIARARMRQVVAQRPHISFQGGEAFFHAVQAHGQEAVIGRAACFKGGKALFNARPGTSGET
jgi:hypothetical protein